MPFWLLSAGSGLLLAGLCVVLWTRRPPPPLWPIAFGCQLFALIWVVGDLWSSHATGMTEKQIALSVLFTGSIALPPLWWETSRRYIVWQGLSRTWMQSRWTRLPVAYAALAWLFMLTNPWHGQFIEPVVGGRNQYYWGVTTVAWIHWGITLATFALCAWASRRHAEKRVRRKLAILAAATLFPLVTNFLHVQLPLGPGVDIVAVGLGLSSLVVIYGITSSRLFDLAPVALHELLRRDPAGVLLLDRDGRLLLWNPAAEKLFAGIEFEPDLLLLEVLSDCLEEADGAGDGLVCPSGPRLFRSLSEPDEAWRRISISSLASSRGTPAAACVRVEDATAEVRDAREHRDRQERELSAATAHTLAAVAEGIAHDFNNVLTTIAGRAELALAATRPDASPRDDLDAIVKAAALARDLTAQLQSRRRSPAVHREPVDLSALVLDMREVLRDSVAPHVTLQLDVAEGLLAVEADPTQLQQVVLNLVKNAGEAIGDSEGRVVVRTLAADAGVQIEVADTGPGLGVPERERAFEPFFTTKGEGRGLGLALVASSVQAHGGTVEFGSGAGGAGTCVRVRLPGAPA
ncbi:MAG: hypothetical protein JRG76_11475 [Deltaproteobacteria bacterium]|nr:hypothetical protein [Deltaproteobacteria bacterium]MBW2415117.1 hypothetical protein [Deltaproteobacteria bacterium]